MSEDSKLRAEVEERQAQARIMELEAANRLLRDELKVLYDEVDRAKALLIPDGVEGWQTPLNVLVAGMLGTNQLLQAQLLDVARVNTETVDRLVEMTRKSINAELVQDNAALMKDVETLRDKVGDLEDEISDLETDLESVKEDAREQEARADDLEEQLEEIQRHPQQDEMEGMAKAYIEVCQERDDLLKQLETIEDAARELEELREHLEDQAIERDLLE